ncbi:type II secretion system protein GspM [Desulfobotulus sp. H1]|uniref:Type II secretion system protein GspM n=1 Tax=Desulfobotulus pelophilus TaxID=2823377 RepID=A0ABT3N667_9BACT|nr:type II secretion system protein GspM [Desulfobotulus pelophilus]MCW7752958.1 type II secretion system protein GspM [Desulfobotulus pelophilus]
MLFLSRREKMIILAAGLILAALMVDQLIFSPVRAWQQRLDRSISVKSQNLEELRGLAERYRNLQGSDQAAVTALAARREDFTLFGFLERVAGETGVKRNIASMKPGTSEDRITGMRFSVVEIRLEDVGMVDVTRFLLQLETAPENVQVRSLSIGRKGAREPATLSVILHAQTLAG